MTGGGSWRRFELCDDRTNKFWHVRLRGRDHTVRYGRIGTNGQQRTKCHPDEEAAVRAVERLIASKLKKGYRELAPEVDWSDAAEGWRPPTELAELEVAESLVERQLLTLRREAADKPEWREAQAWLATADQAGLDQRLCDELSDRALDLGASFRFPEDVLATPAGQRRGQREAADLYSKRIGRERYVTAIMGLLAERAEPLGLARLVDLVLHGESPSRRWAAHALAHSDTPLLPGELDRLLTTLEAPEAEDDYVAAVVAATRSMVRERPSDAFTRLREYLRARSVKSTAGRKRAEGILAGVRETSVPEHPEWAALVFPLIRYARLAKPVLESIEELSPSAVPRLISWLEQQSNAGLQTSHRALMLLGRAAAREALPILTRALLNHASATVCLDAIARIHDDAAVTAVEQYLTQLRARGITECSRIDHAERVLVELRARGLDGAAPSPPVEKAFPKRDRTRKRRAPKIPATPTLEEQWRELLTELRSVGLEQYAECLIEPSIHVFTARDISEPFGPGATKLGGAPDLAVGSEWPRHRGRPLAFVGQFQLAELVSHDVGGVLPPSGLLSFFVMDHLGPNDTEDYLQVGRVLYSDGEELGPLAAPEPVDPFLPCRLVFRSILELRAPSHTRVTSRLSEEEVLRYDGIWAEGPYAHKLLGPRGQRYPYERDPDDVLLLRCVSDPHPDMAWGDSDDVAFWISAAALRARAFQEAFVHCGY